MFQKIFGFTTCGSVAYGDGFYLISFHHFLYFGYSLCGFVHRSMRINVLIVEQIALCIQAYYLTACTEARINAHYPFLSQRGSEQ